MYQYFDLPEIFFSFFLQAQFLNNVRLGFQQAAPISIHREDLDDVEEQLRFLVHVVQGTEINSLLPTLSGSFSSWFWTHLGIKVGKVT